jgi:phosphopantothenate synthetase
VVLVVVVLELTTLQEAVEQPIKAMTAGLVLLAQPVIMVEQAVVVLVSLAPMRLALETAAMGFLLL